MEPRRKYDREVKVHAVQLSQQDGVSIPQVARELGINVGINVGLNVKLLYRWRAEAQQAGGAAFPGQGHLAGEDDAVRRLQRDILKKALGVLARPPS